VDVDDGVGQVRIVDVARRRAVALARQGEQSVARIAKDLG